MKTFCIASLTILALSACAGPHLERMKVEGRHSGSEPVQPSVVTDPAIGDRGTWKPDAKGGANLEAKGPKVLAMGPGAHYMALTFTEPMTWVQVEIFSDDGFLVARKEMHPINDSRMNWEVAYWMDPDVYIDGREYTVWSSGADMAGNLTVARGEGTTHITAADTDARISQGGRSFQDRIVFRKDKANDNMDKPWALELKKSLGK